MSYHPAFPEASASPDVASCEHCGLRAQVAALVAALEAAQAELKRMGARVNGAVLNEVHAALARVARGAG